MSMKREDGGSTGVLAAGLPDRRPKTWRWLVAGVVAVVAPKCILCAAGYLIVLTGASWAGPELCGGSAAESLPAKRGLVGGVVVVAILGMAVAWLVRIAGRRV